MCHCHCPCGKECPQVKSDSVLRHDLGCFARLLRSLLANLEAGIACFRSSIQHASVSWIEIETAERSGRLSDVWLAI